MDLIAGIKSKLRFDDLFRELYPHHYHENGNSRCPAAANHKNGDERPSFQVEKDHGFCHMGCRPSGKSKSWDIFSLWRFDKQVDFKTAVKELGEKYGIPTEQKTKKRELGPVVETYVYTDESGRALYGNRRHYSPKSFSLARPDGNGGWISGKGCMDGIPRVLYLLPQVTQAETVWFVEGEKDVHSLEALGLTATTVPQGADKHGSKWPSLVEKYAIHQPLKDKHVIICPDNDVPGRAHAEAIAKTLHAFTASLKVITVPGPEKSDVSDFIAQHGPERAKRRLLALAQKAPEYVPAEADQKNKSEEPKETRFSKLLTLFYSTGAEAFLDQHNSGWICLKMDGISRNIRINSSGFFRLMLRFYVDKHSEPVNKETITQAGELLEARAEETRKLYNRFAWVEGKLFIDTGLPTWESIEVSSSGVRIVRLDKPPFKRFAHQQPLSLPTEGGRVSQVLSFLPLKDERARILIQIWLVAALIENIPRPALTLHGEQGSGKSTVSEFLRALLDASSVPTLALSKDPTEFVQMMSHHAVVSLDNLHGMPQWASDCICRGITGSGFSKRQLYSDDSDVIYQFSRVFILNGINIPGTSPDLLDRSILLEFQRLPEEDRREVDELAKAFEQARPRILGGMLNTLSKAMSIRETLKPSRLPRMADWTVWGCAIAEALGIGQDAFLKAYYSVINFQHEEIVNSEPVCMVVVEFMKDRTTRRQTPTELYHALVELAGTMSLAQSRRWPKAPHSLTTKLKNFSHNLAQVGIHIRMERSGAARWITIEKRDTPKDPDAPSQASQRHDSNETKQLEMTIPMTVAKDTMKTVTDTVTANGLASQSNDDSDGNDDLSGTPGNSDLSEGALPFALTEPF